MHRIQMLSRFSSGCLLAFVAIVALEHVLVPRSPSDYMISEYVTAGGIAGVVAALALLAWSASLLAAAVLSARVAPQSRAERRLAILSACLGLAALGLLVAATFPTQAVGGILPAGVDRTLAGRLHDLGGGLAQLAIFAAALVSVTAVRWPPGARIAPIALVAITLVLGPGLAAFDIDARGLRQRGLVVVACAWQLALVATLARTAEK